VSMHYAILLNYEKGQSGAKKTPKGQETNRGPRLTPGGLRPQHVLRDGREGATPGNAGRGRQQESAQSVAHPASSKRAGTSRHGRISNRSPNQKYIVGKNRAHSSTNRAGTSGEEAERIQEPRNAKAADSRRVEGVNTQRLAHPRGSNSVTREKDPRELKRIEEIKPQISRTQATRRGGFAAEQEMLDAAPAAFQQGVPPRSGRWQPGDTNLVIRTGN
jgi:hypothetical protein